MKAKDIVYDNLGRTDPDHREDIIDAMKQYAKIKCAEQRENCVRNWATVGDGHEEESHAIMNAPEPEFD